MKVVREIKPVSVYAEYNNNKEITLDLLDSEPGYYEHVIRPMMKKGHEGELINFLKISGLIPQYQKCKNSSSNENCRKPLTWYSSRTIDKYQWKCLNCSQKYSIRKNSMFADIRCNIKDAIRLILGWCKGQNIETMASILGIRKQVVHFVYKLCSTIAWEYINHHPQEWQLGGLNTIVIIDVYPEGYEKFTSEGGGQFATDCIPIVCIAEAKDLPPRYWFEILDKNLKTPEDQTKAAVEIVKKIVRPGSILVANLNSAICSYYSLQELNYLYPIIVSVDGLQRHNSEDQSILDNLKVIWQLALNTCSSIQSNNQIEVENNVSNALWMRRFGSESFQMLLNQMCCSDT